MESTRQGSERGEQGGAVQSGAEEACSSGGERLGVGVCEEIAGGFEDGVGDVGEREGVLDDGARDVDDFGAELTWVEMELGLCYVGFRHGRVTPSVAKPPGATNTAGALVLNWGERESARFAFVLVDEREHEFDDLALLLFGEFSNFFECVLHLAGGSGASAEWRRLRGHRVLTEESFDRDAESFGHSGQDFGARRFIGAFPERDVDLSVSNEASELGLGEPCSFAEREEAGSLRGA